MRSTSVEPAAPDGPAFLVHAEAASPASPLVFDSPHSWPHWSSDAPPTVAPPEALRTSCDAWVDRIWATAIGTRAPLLVARFHRAYIDANRARDDIDPSLLAQPWPEPLHPTDKSRHGMGLLRRLALPQVPMYDRPLALHDVQRRIRCCYDPYHARLAQLIDAAHARHGMVLHLDCHSMKSTGNEMNDDNGQPRPDIVVSDLEGSSAAAALLPWMAAVLGERGYRVQINQPYRGGELIRRHGDPTQGRHSVQVELNRALYMDEQRFVRTQGYARLVADLGAFVEQLQRGLRRVLHSGPSPPA